MAAVCWRCIEDEYLKTIVRESGEAAECDLCSRDDEKAFGPDEFSGVLDPLMREHFAQGPEVKKFGEDDNEWYEQEGDPLSHHLQEVIGQYLGFEDEIVEALESNEDVRPQDGEEAFFDSSQDYVPLPAKPHRYVEEWGSVLDELKHRRRFFSSAAKTLFTELFGGVETRQAWAESGKKEDVVWEFAQGSEIYRSRICQSIVTIKDAFSDPYKNVGPPPPERTRPGRMNAEGVAVFYGSLDSETCLAETRPALGNDTAVITLHTTKPLRLLDFRRLEKSYSQLSYFQPDFTEQCEKGAFLRRLQKLISQPIIPGRETDYIITQTLAEYLAHVHETPFDGIIFQSVQRSEGTNIVLFPDMEGKFPLSYVEKSVALYTTKSIQYTHDYQFVHLTEDGVWIDSDYDEEEW